MVEATSRDGWDKRSILTLPNAPNWDYEAPASFLNKQLAFCANASVHVLNLVDDGFTFQCTVGFAAKFKKQFCRCVSVCLLQRPSKSILVSLDKRSVVWEPLSSTENQIKAS